MDKVVVGFTGPAGSGKGVLAHHLESKGFKYISLSDILREMSGSDDRKILQDLGDKLRSEMGPGVLAILTGEKIKSDDSRFFVVDSIRHPSEIKHLWNTFDAKVIAVNAPFTKLFDNIRRRGRKGDPETLPDFMDMMKREEGKPGSPSMQIARCIHIANAVIWNEGTTEELLLNLDEKLKGLGTEFPKITKERE